MIEHVWLWWTVIGSAVITWIILITLSDINYAIDQLHYALAQLSDRVLFSEKCRKQQKARNHRIRHRLFLLEIKLGLRHEPRWWATLPPPKRIFTYQCAELQE